MWMFDLFFLNFANFICQCTDFSKKFRESLGLRDNGRRLYFNISSESWEETPDDRAKWRCLIRKGPDDYEAKRIFEGENAPTTEI